MRYAEIITESSMSDLADLYQQIKYLPTADVDFDLKTQQIYLVFIVNGLKGTMRLSPKTTTKFRSKLYAAAISVLNGKKPKSWESAMNTLRGKIRNQAIRILTNPSEWKIESIKYGNFII